MQLTGNGIALEVEVHGPDEGEPLLLIMGLGMQLLGWPDGLVDRLVAAGFRVIRFDNRDVGLSQDFEASGRPRLAWQIVRHALRMGVRGPYGLRDMAEDAVAVLDALGIASAHVCGASMGGMVAQHVAARHPSRVSSLTLLMTSSGAPGLPGPTWRVRAALLSKPATADDMAAVVAHYQRFFRIIGSPAFPTDAAELARRVQLAVQRSYRPAGTLRQLVAIAADGDRTPLLRTIRTPTMIIHGDADPMLPPASALDLRRKLANADLDLVPGMGHDLPEGLWPRFVADIVAVADRGRQTQTAGEVRNAGRTSTAAGPARDSET